MSILSFTPAEVVSGQLLPPNIWYTLSIKEIRHANAASGNGSNFFWIFIVESHPQKPEVQIMFHDSFKHLMVPILAAAEKKTVDEWMKDNEKGTNVQLEDLVGVNLQGKLVHVLNKKTDKMQNDFSIYLPAGMTPPL